MNVSHTKSPDTEWFENAGLGLFICPSIASVHGELEMGWGIIEDKTFDTDVAADIPRTEISPEEYFALADEFDPDRWNPDEWLTAAREAGATYTVFVTKHHDGFALWPSAYGEFSTAQYLEGRDLVGEFVDACRRQGLKTGLYFSLPDWHHPDFPRPKTLEELRRTNPVGMGPQAHERRATSSPVGPKEAEQPRLEDGDELVRFERYYRYTKRQLRELLTRYGRIDLLWFDLPLWPETIDHRMEGLYQFARSVQPHIVINGRTHGYDELGDYHTPENVLPEEPMDGWWELCQVWAPPAWAYHVDERYRDLDWTLERLAKTVSLGGNLAINVAPRPDGELPEQAYERMDELSRWMQSNRQAVIGVDPGPWPPRAPVPITRRTGVWYVHVLRDQQSPVVVEDVPKPRDVMFLSTGNDVPYEYDESADFITFEVTSAQRRSGNEVVAITFPPDQHHLV